MAFTEAERVKVRRYLGFAAIYLQAEPMLENALSAVQSTADGGTRPDNSTELDIRELLTHLATIETKLRELWNCSKTLKVDDVTVDPARAMLMLRMEGRRLVGYLAVALGTRPVRDVFSGVPPRDAESISEFGQAVNWPP
jgi:hypothetical protein